MKVLEVNMAKVEAVDIIGAVVVLGVGVVAEPIHLKIIMIMMTNLMWMRMMKKIRSHHYQLQKFRAELLLTSNNSSSSSSSWMRANFQDLSPLLR